MKDTEKKQKKGFMAAIWESMNKTGGCCGSGESCCGSPQPNDGKEKAKEKNARPPNAGATR